MSYLATELRRIGLFIGVMFRERKLESVEILLAAQALVLGWWLLAPWHTFTSIVGVYDTLALVPEGVWGGVFALHGALHLRAIDRGDIDWRRRFTSGLVLLWSMMLCGFIVTAPTSTAIPMYFLPVLGGMWCYHAHTLIAADRRSVPRD